MILTKYVALLNNNICIIYVCYKIICSHRKLPFVLHWCVSLMTTTHEGLISIELTIKIK